MNTLLRLIVFGAHPDDCDIFAGGLAAKYVALGHAVKFVSLTNGDAGHHAIGGEALAKRRTAESKNAAKVLGIEYDVLDNHDGELLPTLEVRRQVIRLIRQWKANIVITHRPNDYHPDHRNAATVVQDSSYLVKVPNICPEVPTINYNPYFFYLWDKFQKPYSFQPDVAFSIDDVMVKKWDMLHCHESQMYEWLPEVGDHVDELPNDTKDRRAWLEEKWTPFMLPMAECARKTLLEKMGVEKAKQVKFAECFEICEYGAIPTEDDLKRLFPF